MTDKIGEGTYSNVYVKDDIAIKEFKGDISLYSAIKEIAIIKYLSSNAHPNILSLMSISALGSNYTLYMKKYDGDLSSFYWLDHDNASAISIKLMLGIAAAADYLSKANILHGDIKPQNILYNVETHTAVLCDFNLSSFEPTGKISTLLQSPRYRAPEVDISVGYAELGVQIDIWSIGCVYYEMVTKTALNTRGSNDSTIGICDFIGINGYQTRDYRLNFLYQFGAKRIAYKLSNIDTIVPYGNITGALLRLIASCLIPKPSARITAARLLLEFSKMMKIGDYLSAEPIRLLSKNQDVTIINDGYAMISDYSMVGNANSLDVRRRLKSKIKIEPEIKQLLDESTRRQIHYLELTYYQAIGAKKIYGSDDALVIFCACVFIVSCFKDIESSAIDLHKYVESANIKKKAREIMQTIDYSPIM